MAEVPHPGSGSTHTVRFSGSFAFWNCEITGTALIPTVQTVLKVPHSFDFSLAGDELGALPSTRRAPILRIKADNIYAVFHLFASEVPRFRIPGSRFRFRGFPPAIEVVTDR